MDVLCWIRRDLRLSDHRALSEATRRGRRVAIAFCYDRNILDRLESREDRRVSFIHGSLAEIARRLESHGSMLLTVHGDPVREIPRLAADLGAKLVACSQDAEPKSKERERQVGDALGAAGISFETFRDQTVFGSEDIRTSSGASFRVFTPFERAWRARLSPADLAPHPVDENRFWPRDELPGHLRSGPTSLEEIGFAKVSTWVRPGEAAARERLSRFLEGVDRYPEDRDFPAREGTSGLSAALRHGCISIREAFRSAMALPGPGARKWTSELIWREFYQGILDSNPRVVGDPFRRDLREPAWPGDAEALAAWAEGRTGFPLVDAAQRCLVQTGWMHNRLRMVSASFLCKDLLVDWRKGEKFFAKHLLDYDLASNNGGWQWCASTGADAQPYFRVMNPTTQSQKFDPHGEFIRRWLPELGALSSDQIHQPPRDTLGRAVYPAPIVDHAEQRSRLLALFQSAKIQP